MNNLEVATKSAGLEAQYLEFTQENRTDLQGSEGVSVYFQLFQTSAFNASSSEYSNTDINNTLPNGDVFLTTNSTNATSISTGYTVAQTVILALLAGSTSLITIAGNLVVILFFILERTIRQPANYFIASLAVSDLLIGSVSMPFYTVYLLAGQYWPLGANLCDLWLSIDYTVCLCSIYTVFCITVDRFCSVKIPAKYRNWRTDRKVLLMICVTWTVPVIVFFTSIFGWQYFVGERTVAEGKCYVQYMESPVFNALLQVGYFWITLIIMCLLYTGIYKVALRLQTRSEEKYRKMASLVSVAGQAMSKIGIGMSQQEEQIQRQPASAQIMKGTPLKECYAMGDGNVCEQLTAGKSGPPDRKSSRSVCPPDGPDSDESSDTDDSSSPKHRRHKKKRTKKVRSKGSSNGNNAVPVPDPELCYIAGTVPSPQMNCTTRRVCDGLTNDKQGEVNREPVNREPVNREPVKTPEGVGRYQNRFSKSQTVETVLSPTSVVSPGNFELRETECQPTNAYMSYLLTDGDEGGGGGEGGGEGGGCSNCDLEDVWVLRKKDCRTARIYDSDDSLSPVWVRRSLQRKKNKQTRTEKQPDIVAGSGNCNKNNSPHEIDQTISDGSTKGRQKRKRFRDCAVPVTDDVMNGHHSSDKQSNNDRKRRQNSTSSMGPFRCWFNALRFHRRDAPAAGTSADVPKRETTRGEDRAVKALRTITIILGAFVLCWTPWHILSLIMGFCANCVEPTLYDISYWLCYLNSPINPFCYACANQQFKKTFLRIFKMDWRQT